MQIEPGVLKMKIKLHLRGPLKKFGSGPEPFSYEIAGDKSTVKDLIQELGLPRSAISFVAINGNKTVHDRQICENDEVVIYPRVAGG